MTIKITWIYNEAHPSEAFKPLTANRHTDYSEAAKLLELGEFTKLRKFCAEAVRVYPWDHEFWNLYGVSHFYLGATEDAKKCFLRAFRLDRRLICYLKSFWEVSLASSSLDEAFSVLLKEFPQLSPEAQSALVAFFDELIRSGRMRIQTFKDQLGKGHVLRIDKLLLLYKFAFRHHAIS